MPDLPPLNALRAFESAARHESFAKAAAELSVTPSAVSHRIRNLEEALGATLFHRDVRSVRLTAAGRDLLPDASAAFERLSGAVARLRERDRTPTLRVSAAPAFASGWLIPRLARLRGACPGLELRLDASMAIVDLPSPDIDAAIRYTADPAGAGLRTHRLFDDEMIAVCSPVAARGLRSPADLAGATLLHTSTGCGDWVSWLAAAGASGVDAGSGPELATDTLALEAATHGLGVALAHRRIAGTRLAEGTLVAPFGTVPLVRHAYHLVYADGLEGRPEIAAFRRWLLDAVDVEEAGRGEAPALGDALDRDANRASHDGER